MPHKVEATRDGRRTWTVGELADELGVTTRTMRFYEAEGLITPKRAGTARVYGQRDHARMRLILRGRRFGMTLG
ncbi:MAG: MerR family transcriptional regulator, partial [Jatrophihabitantaceae bacterium]